MQIEVCCTGGAAFNPWGNPPGERGKPRYSDVKFLILARNWQSWDRNPEAWLPLPAPGPGLHAGP